MQFLKAVVAPAKQGRRRAYGLKARFQGHISDPQLPLAFHSLNNHEALLNVGIGLKTFLCQFL